MASTESSHQTSARLLALQAKLKSRTGPDGKPRAGYTRNVKELQDEISRLEAQNALG